MELMGIGAGFLSWSRFLSPSPTRAVVNGFLSPIRDFGGGVRQGCPLSPALYQFIGQALSSWLDAKGFGFMIAMHRYVAQ
jgi:hypothetical protein